MSGELARASQRARPEHVDFGPWWWRLRCWLSQRALGLGIWLEPDDQRTTSWSDDGETITFATVRQRHG